RDGEEHRRRAGRGRDWAIVRLGMQGAIRRVELSTAHYKGNYPDSASIEATVVKDESRGVSADVSTRENAGWTDVLPQTKLQPDHLHEFADELRAGVHASHVRLNIFPDGGVGRVRVYGIPLPDARRQAVVRQLNAMDAPELRAAFADFCAAPAWIDRMTAYRPVASARALPAAADEAAKGVPDADWLQGLPHPPLIREGTTRG